MMPDWFIVTVLGIIEGVTEFLPVSSTGHLLIAEQWVGRQTDLFNVGIQSGAILAVLLVFTGRLRRLLVDWREPDNRDYLAKLGMAFGVTAMGGLVLKRLDFSLPETIMPVAWATLLGGVLLLGIERWMPGRRARDLISWPTAVLVGMGQVIAATFPGASRSGSTILMALGLGVSRPAATEFSFLLGVPTLLSAGGFVLVGSLGNPEGLPVSWKLFVLGIAVSAATAFVVVRWLLRFVQTHTFEGFAWYRIGLGVVLLLLPA